MNILFIFVIFILFQSIDSLYYTIKINLSKFRQEYIINKIFYSFEFLYQSPFSFRKSIQFRNLHSYFFSYIIDTLILAIINPTIWI